ncbi:MAG: hypothetical protein RIK87_29385 [Fuerstiella sp.]
MDKLKKLLLAHGEKIVASICVLLGFMALSSASWSPNSRSPLEIQDLTTKGTAQIEMNQWPEEEKVTFEEIPDVESMVRDNSKILTRAEDFQIGALNPSIQRVKEKRSAVDVLAPEDPRAVALVFPLAMPPEEEEEESAEGDPAVDVAGTEKKSDEELSEDEQIEKLIAEKFGLKKGATAGGIPGMEGYGGEAMEGYPGMESSFPGGGVGGAGGTDAMVGYPGMAGGGAGYEGGDYGGSELYGTYGSEMMSVKKNIRVSAGVSVTMVVDLQKQRNALRTALHLPSDYRVAQQYIQYVDLTVERRQKVGPNVWDPWEPVSSEDLGEILKDSFGIDRDIVSPAVTRSTITMPLPRRAAGEWQPSEASHPRVENFELSAEEKALIDKWNQRVSEKLATEKENLPVTVEQKGFSQFVQSATDLGTMYSGMGGYGGMGGMGGMGAMGGGYEGGSGYESAFDYSDFAQSMGGGELTAEQRQLLDETKATADHRLLLVRFMDFTVERGYAYQYRVRLEMKNPNYNHPLDELEDPGLSVEPTLFSDWSPPTPDVFVSLPHRTYLTKVDGREGRPEEVTVSVYTDTTETGLPVIGTVNAMMGLPVAGRQNIELVDLTTEEVGLREITLETNEVLSAAEEIERASTSEHRDIRAVIDQTRGRVVPDQICVIDSEGSLKLRFVGQNADQERQDRMEAAAILKIYDAWKKKNMPTNDFFGAGEGGGYEGAGLGMEYGASSAGGYYGGGGGSERGSSRSSRRDRRSSSRRSGREAP